MNSAAAKTLILMLGLLLLFSLHRFLAMPFLGGALLSAGMPQSVPYFVGLLSDVWLAGLSGLLFFLAVSLPQLRPFSDFIAAGFVLLWGILLSLHQPYVEFFHFQFMPFHIRYLADMDFIAANGSSLFNPRAFIQFGAATWLAWQLKKQSFSALASKNIAFAVLLFCWAGAAVAHSANLHYRVQLFVPLELQTNVAERLYYHLKTPTEPEDFTAEELTRVAESIDLPAHATAEDILFTQPHAAGPVDPLLVSMREGMLQRMQAGRKPLVIVLLLESLRPAESGLYASSDKTWTPFLDGLARESIWFPHAYATSNVTRGGQEAAWCGYLSSATTSMMRGRPDVRLPCLPVMLAAQVKDRVDGESMWLHGGRRAFDDQTHFWRRQSVEHILSQENFPDNTVRTDWGVSDRVLLQRSIIDLAQLRASSGKDVINAMVLTVTNHIPWKLPSDAPASVVPSDQTHMEPHWLTTQYTDVAVAEFVHGLRQTDLWDDTVLVVASDHGMAGRVDAAVQPKTLSNEEQLSHMFLLMSGGVVHEALRKNKLNHDVRKETVSQADIAPTLAYLTGHEDKDFQGELLFTPRRRPVVADFGPHVYFPALQLSMSRGEVLQGSAANLSAEQKNARSYYRTFLHWLSQK